MSHRACVAIVTYWEHIGDFIRKLECSQYDLLIGARTKHNGSANFNGTGYPYRELLCTYIYPLTRKDQTLIRVKNR
jgi:hypothetical protein